MSMMREFAPTEEFVIIDRYLSKRFFSYSIALYSPRDKICCYLPPIPHLRTGFPSSCQCVSLHGKIYVLGGQDEFHMGTPMGFDIGIENVYVLNLYGERQWKSCTSMESRRLDFGCCVFDGKIYVFGGSHFEETFRESEMYDPEVDAWFPIESIPSFRARHQVVTVGEELIVYGGTYYSGDEVAPDRVATGDSLDDAVFLEIYNPVMGEWSGVGEGDTQEDLFVARGKLHSITQFAIHVYDGEKKYWTLLHTCSFAIIGPDDHVRVRPRGTVAVDDELLVRVYAFNTDGRGSSSFLLRSRGFGSQNKTIVWETAEGSPSFQSLSTHRSEFLAIVEV